MATAVVWSESLVDSLAAANMISVGLQRLNEQRTSVYSIVEQLDRMRREARTHPSSLLKELSS